MIFEPPRSWNWRAGLTGALLAAVLGLAALWFPLVDQLVNLSYDLPFLPRYDIDVRSNEVVIVYMDEESHDRLGQPWHMRWDRSLHAQLIDRMTRDGARMVVFDALFSVTNDPVADASLVKAARENRRVLVASMMALQSFEGEIIGSQAEYAFPALRAVTLSGWVEASGLGRMVRQHYRPPDRPEPSLAWQAARFVITNTPQPFAERWVNYYGPPGTIPSVSYHTALHETATLSFSNKIVFVGALYNIGFTGGKGTDDFATPYSLWTGRRSPGVEINATTFLNLIRGDWLFRPAPMLEVGLILAMAALFGCGLAFCRPIPALILAGGGALLVAALGILLPWKAHVILPWLVVVTLQIPTALACSVFVYTRRLTHEKKSLEQVFALLKKGEHDEATSQAEPSALPGFVRHLPSLRQPSESYSSSSLASPPKAGRDNSPPALVIPNHELLSRIGQGAYGEVWLARDIIGTFHAVKVVHRGNFKDARPLEREFHGLTKFTPISRSHPGFVHILHVGRNQQPEYIYYVMELGDDESSRQPIDPQTYSPRSLARELQRRRRLPLAECVQISIQLTDALQFLHEQQLIHRDIKPANILFVKGVPKFADIGLVTGVASDGGEVTYVGTPGRIAPEGPGSPTADVFSLGKVIYEMGIGLPLERFPELPTTLVEGIEEDGLFQLNRIILKACEMNVRTRYQSAAELRVDLLALQLRSDSAEGARPSGRSNAK